MSNLAKYVSLKTVVSYFLDEGGKSFGDFDRAWVLAFRAMIKMGFMISFEPKTVRLPVSGNKTVAFPSDYISWSKIGVLNESGEVCSINVNNALSTFKDSNPNRISQLTSDVQNTFTAITGIPDFINYYTNGAYFNLYGVGGGMIEYGQCRVDEKNNVIVLDPNFRYPHIILEYISNPEQDDDYQIELCLQEAVIAFIKWKLKLGTREEFYAEATEGRRSINGKKVTVQTINEVIRASNGMKLKA